MHKLYEKRQTGKDEHISAIAIPTNQVKNFVTDRREDFLVVFETEVLNDDREFRGVGTREDSES